MRKYLFDSTFHATWEILLAYFSPLRLSFIYYISFSLNVALNEVQIGFVYLFGELRRKIYVYVDM